MSKPNPVPHPQATPYLCCRDAARALDFYKQAFAATEVMRLAEPGGRIGHAELRIGDALVMLSDEHPDHGVRSPQALGGSPVAIHLYVGDVDAVVARAVAAGARLDRPVQDEFYGDRTGVLCDPFGHRWFVATHIEDVPAGEMERRYAAMLAR